MFSSEITITYIYILNNLLYLLLLSNELVNNYLGFNHGASPFLRQQKHLCVSSCMEHLSVYHFDVAVPTPDVSTCSVRVLIGSRHYDNEE